MNLDVLNKFKDIFYEINKENRKTVFNRDYIKLYKEYNFPNRFDILIYTLSNIPLLVIDFIDSEDEEILYKKKEMYMYCLENNITYILLNTNNLNKVVENYHSIQDNIYLNNFKNVKWKKFKDSLELYNVTIPLTRVERASVTTKQVIVVRRDLMNPIEEYAGKMMAQSAHASLGVMLKEMTNGISMIDEEPKIDEDGCYDLNLKVKVGSVEDRWLRGIFTKVVTYVDSEEELMKVYQKALDEGLKAILIQDNGLTKFNGKTLTAVAIGPDLSLKIDKVTKRLRLL